MCLVTNWKKPRIAKRDIICYKELYNDLTSAFFYFKWPINEVCSQSLQTWRSKTFATYDNITSVRYRKNIMDLTVNGARDQCNIYKFKIPAGSEYFKDSTGLIVANQMMLISDKKIEV